MWLRRLSLVCLLGIVLLGLCRNLIVGGLAPVIFASLIDAELQLEGVDIGWMQIRLTGITVGEPGLADSGDQRLAYLHLDALKIELSSEDGLDTGRWIKRIQVVRPHLQLRLDADGNLETQFPVFAASEEPAEKPLPLTSLAVVDASGMPPHHLRLLTCSRRRETTV